MMRQSGAPGMQHQGKANACTQMTWIGSDGLQCFGGNLKQQTVDHRFVGVSDLADWRG